MRTIKSIFVLGLALALFSCGKSGADYRVAHYLCDFEGEYWDGLVDSPQYMGKLLYSENPYSWFDGETNLVSESDIFEYDGFYYWNNGTALSNYFTTDYNSAGSYEEQLTVFAESAYSGQNCIVCTGYYSGVAGDYRPSLYFKDGKPRFIGSMMVANTTYSRYVVENGNHMTGPLAENQSIWIEAEGFVLNDKGIEESVATAQFYLYKNGRPAFEGWRKWYMTSMCKIYKIKFEVKWDGAGVNNYPAYFAIDDIEVVSHEPIE